MKIDKRKIFTSLYLLAICAALYVVITCAWVGAEYIGEGSVHMGKVDSFFAMAGSYYLTRDWYFNQGKRSKKGTK